MRCAQSVNEVWFHGELSRSDADQRLGEDGDFLVRTSHGKPGEYIISVQSNSEKLNFLCPRAEASSGTINC